MWKKNDDDGIIDAEIGDDGEFKFTGRHRKSVWHFNNRFKALYVALLAASFLLTYLAITLLPFAAIFSFFYIYSNWWLIFAIPAALIVAFIPLLGFMIGIFSAHVVWGWSWFAAILVFCWPFMLRLFLRRKKIYFKSKIKTDFRR